MMKLMQPFLRLMHCLVVTKPGRFFAYIKDKFMTKKHDRD